MLSAARDAGNDRVTVLNVWDSGEAISDFHVERTRPLIEQRGEPTDEPQRHGKPVEVGVRG
ncbi:MAG: hypothetical protein AB1Z67_08710 [Candidatus Limnocylindrales bacterium]